MRKLMESVRRAVAKGHPSAAQLVGIAGMTWGAWSFSAAVGKLVGGGLLALYGVALELGRRPVGD